MPRHLVLVANSGDATVSTLALTTSGDTATLESRATAHVGRRCTALAVDHARDLVHAAIETDAGSAVATLRVDRATGILSHVERRATEAHMAHLALAPGGRLLLGASYHGGVGLVWPLTQEGRLEAATSRVEFSRLHAVAISPDGHHAYFASLGDDLVAQYALSHSGRLTPLDPPTVPCPEGSGPRHLIAPDGRSVYLLTEFSGQAIRFSRDAASGVLTREEAVDAYAPDRGLLPGLLDVEPLERHAIWGADLRRTADGRWLLCSERTESTLATLELDADGRLVRQAALAATETQPRGFDLTPDGRFVVAVGERSTQATVSHIGDDGTLTPVATGRVGVKPNWVRVLPLD